MSVEVTGYIVNAEYPGGESSVRKYISAPQISFNMVAVNAMPKKVPTAGVKSGNPDDYILQDLQDADEPSPSQSIGGKSIEGKSEFYNTTSVGGSESGKVPFKVIRVYRDAVTGKEIKQDLEIKSRNSRKGETVYKEQLTFDLGEIVLTPK